MATATTPAATGNSTGTPLTVDAFLTDEPLWYNNGIWGALGYATPNFGANPRTLNQGIGYLVSVIGRNLSAVMHSDDVDLRSPPTINTLLMVKKLIERARTIVSSRAIPANQPQMTGVHDDPAPRDFLVYPVPYFSVANAWLQEWCGLVLMALTEAMQHTENRRTFDFSTDFGGLLGQYLNRIYQRLAIEFFGDTLANTQAANYVIPQTLVSNYTPSNQFTSTELIDTTPPTYTRPTAQDLVVLTNGIPASQLVGLTKWPGGQLPTALVADNSAATAGAANPGNIGSAIGGAGAVASFPPPPTP